MTIAALRRWYILLPLLVLSFAGAYMVGSRVNTDFEVTGSVMLVVPPQTNPNPYADDYATEILGIGLSSSATRDELESQDLSPEYELDYQRGSPIIGMRVVAGSEAMAVRTAEEVVDRLSQTLENAQSERKVPDAQRVTVDVVDAPDVAEPVVTGRLRLTAVIALLGGILSLVCAVVADALLLRRRKRARAATPEPAPPEPTPIEPAPPAPEPQAGKQPRSSGRERRPVPSKS